MRAETFASGEELFAEHARRVAERVGGEPAAVRARVEELLGARVCRALRAAGPRPDARAALEQAAAVGLALGVVSDYEVDAKLEALGLADLPFAARVAADALGALKPHARAYEAAAAALGVPAAAVCHVGDRLDTDVRAAEAAGMSAILLGPPEEGATHAPTLSAAVAEVLARA
jgi:HAD superfamily hydrolase (TIGR01509 family)